MNQEEYDTERKCWLNKGQLNSSDIYIMYVWMEHVTRKF